MTPRRRARDAMPAPASPDPAPGVVDLVTVQRAHAATLDVLAATAPERIGAALATARPARPARLNEADGLELRRRELTTLLQGELRLLEELGAALAVQRRGVVAGDAAAIESSTQAVSRTLLTLEAARRCVAEVLDDLGDTALPGENARMQAHLLRAAAGVQCEATTNQALLRRAHAAADAYLQALFSGAAEPRRGDRREDVGADGVT